MMARYKPLFTIAVSHAYTRGVCADCTFVIIPETARVMRGARLLVKADEGRLRMLYEANSVGDPVLSAADKTLYFGLKLGNPYFANEAEFGIAFQARQDRLRYYLVARNFSDAEMAQLSVSDTGFASEGRAEVAFRRIAPAAFAVEEIQPAMLGPAESKVVLFESEAAVARQAIGMRGIQLKRNGTTLVSHLPQPGPERSNAEVIVQLSKP